MRGPETGDCAGHARGARADEAAVRNHRTGRVEVHVASGRGRRGLAEIEEILATVEVQGHEAAAAEIPGFRGGDRKHEGGRDGGIDGIAPVFEHLSRRLGAVAVGCRDRRNARDRVAGREHEQQRDDEGAQPLQGAWRDHVADPCGWLRRSSMLTAREATSSSWASSRQGSTSAATCHSRIAGSASRRAA